MVLHKGEGTYRVLGEAMRLSIVIACLDSHEVVRRQALYFQKMFLPVDVELILVDDGSNPPLKDYPPFKIFQHHNPAQWTQPAARNHGVRQAKGEYLICTDIDHILTWPLIQAILDTKYDYIKFRREVAIINEQGEFVQTEEAVKAYGYDRFERNGFHIAPHTNSWAIKRQLYLDCGGVSERLVGTGAYPNREELPLRSKLKALRNEGKITFLDADTEGDPRPTIYMFPNGRFCGDRDYNPFGLFHNLSRDPEKIERTRLTNKEKARLARS